MIPNGFQHGTLYRQVPREGGPLCEAQMTAGPVHIVELQGLSYSVV